MQNMENFDPMADPMEVPPGGIASFIPDETDVLGQAAAMGRNGDTILAHLTNGEFVVPQEFMEDDVVRNRLYELMREEGIEDPERYLVGADANSINPETGLPEFGLGSLLKKVAKVVLPIALSFTPLGPVFGAGIGTLLSGGNIKDAFRSGLMGGIAGGLSGPGTFGQNVSASLANPVGRVGQTISGAGRSLGVNDSGIGRFFNRMTGTPGAPVSGVGAEALAGDVGAEAGGFFSRYDPRAQPRAAPPVAQPGTAQPVAQPVAQPGTAQPASTNPPWIDNLLRYGQFAPLARALIDEEPEEQTIGDIETGVDLFNENPNDYMIQNLGPMSYNTRSPNRIGEIGMNEGIPGEDSVPASLTPGEFVMTADAVQGAGGGNHKQGVQNMYGLMRNLTNKNAGVAYG